LGTQWARMHDPIVDAWREAGRLAGWPTTPDINGAEGVGFGRSQFTIRDGRRASASNAYLRPVMQRPGLTLRTGALAHRVTMRGTRATGVDFMHNGRTEHAEAAREVILCGGVFNSPQLLMLSGIGPEDQLREHGIAPLVDLPVGRNLQDHLGVALVWNRREPGPFHRELRLDRAVINMARAMLFRDGPATTLPLGEIAFVKSRPDLEAPDIEFLLAVRTLETRPWLPGWQAAYQDAMGIRPVLLHPRSRGAVTLRSADPAASVRITFNFFSEPEDLAALRNAYHLARDVAGQKPLDHFRGQPVAPGPDVLTNTQIENWIRNTVVTVNHPLGTCAIGVRGVLDPELKVHGVEGLRVVDASALPDMPSAHINAIVMMLAERASDLIRGRPPLAPANV
jgi:4-pyridoxate dehydrogenase